MHCVSTTVGLFPGSAIAPVLRCTSLNQIDPISEHPSRRSFQLVPPSAPSKSLTRTKPAVLFGYWVLGFEHMSTYDLAGKMMYNISMVIQVHQTLEVVFMPLKMHPGVKNFLMVVWVKLSKIFVHLHFLMNKTPILLL